MLPEKILVIADRDDPRHLALRAALDLGRGRRVRITVVGFVHDPLAEDLTMVTRTEARRLRAALLRQKRAWLADSVARVATTSVTVRQRVVWARDIAGWAVAEAARTGCGLIAKTGHRSENFLHTPTDWALLRQSRVPVLIVRDRLPRRPGPVLVALDLLAREAGRRALDGRVLATACAVAGQLRADLHAVSAIPLSTLAHDMDLIDRAELERRSRKKLAADIAALAAGTGLPTGRFRLKAGPPDRVISGTGSKLKASLLVMGTVGRRGVRARLLGNTAEKVLHRNRVSVLVVPPG